MHSFAKLQRILMQARDDPMFAAKGMHALFSEENSNSFKPTLDLKESRISRAEWQDDTIQSKVALLEHAAKCAGCASSNCKSEKNVFDHNKSCSEKPNSACQTRTSLINLSVIHARKCPAFVIAFESA